MSGGGFLKSLKDTVQIHLSKFNFEVTINSIEGLDPKKINGEEVSFAWERGDKKGTTNSVKLSVSENNSCEFNQSFLCYGKFEKDKKTNTYKKKDLLLTLREVIGYIYLQLIFFL